MNTLGKEVENILESNILNYWLDKTIDNEHGGFYGEIDGQDNVVAKADKGAILNARILWAFSAAYRVLRKPAYLEAATRAMRYVIDKFVDKENGGVYWSVDYKGNPVDTKKQIYAIGFTIYGLSEYSRATGDKESLDCAISLFHDIEAHAFDKQNNGYIEALTKEWNAIEDMRLSDKDENMSKTMNTHLHIIEPYTNLYRVWKDAELESKMRNLLDIFTTKILNPHTSHLDLFFNEEWEGKRNIQSFGHDIEASWLLHETALVLNDEAVIKKITPIVKAIASAADEGLVADGAMIYEKWLDDGRTDTQRHWWVQCENVIGHANLYQHFDDKNALDITNKCLSFIRENIIDWKNGEWHWGVYEDGTINQTDDKAGFWKCPYHNTRMCLELIERDL